MASEGGMEEPRYRDDMYRDDTKYRDDTIDFDNAMDEHAPNLHSSLQNTENLVRGIVQNAMAPQHRKRSSNHGVRRSSTSTSASQTPKQRDPHRTASLNHGPSSLANGLGTGGNTPGIPSMDEISLLINRLSSERQKTANLQGSLTQAHADLAFQSKRLESAEMQLDVLRKKDEETTTRRKDMEINLSKMREQLKFMKQQYDAAVAEIKKAQHDIDQLDEERHKAVEEVAREKEKVRKLLEERKLKEAREEGYNEGMRMGREEGVRMGVGTGRKYGVRDGKDAEKKRQNQALRDLVQDVEEGVDLPETDSQRPTIRETYNLVGDETPGANLRSMSVDPNIGFGRSRPNTAPIMGNGMMPAVTIDPQTHTAAVIGLPVLPQSAPLPTTTNQPSYQQNRQAPYGSGNPNINITNGAPGRPNPNINILTGGQGLAEPGPGMSSRQGNRNSAPAPPRINTDPSGQRSWGGGAVGTGTGTGVGTGNNLGYRAPVAPIRNRSNSGGTRPGRSTVTPPSASTQGRSTPLDQYDILGHPEGGGRMSAGGGLREQVNEMTPIMEAGSEPAPSPVGAYFNDAAMGIRAPQQQQTQHQQRQGQHHPHQNQHHPHQDQHHPHQDQHHPHQDQHQQYHSHDRSGSDQGGSTYVPPYRRSGGQSVADQATQWRQPTGQAKGRKAVPGDGSSSDGYGRGSGSGGRGGHTRSQSHAQPVTHSNIAPNGNVRAGRSRGASVSGQPGGADGIMPPIEVQASTPPTTANDRSVKMAQAGDALMGKPAFQGSTGYGAPQGQHNGVHGQRRQAGPHGTPIGSPQPGRSPLPTQRELTRDDVVASDPSGGRYRPTSEQYGYGQGQPAINGHGRGASMSAVDKDLPRPSPSPRFNANQNLAQPTPRRYSHALDMSPEVIQIHPSGTTPVATPFDLNGRFIGGDTAAPAIPPVKGKGKGKGKVSAEAKKRRREGFVDYDDEVPQIGTLGYGPQDQEPPQTTRSRVQSMYGIRPGDDPNRSPMFNAPPLPTGGAPQRTPVYEDAPLPLPKSARMMASGLPAGNGGYGRGGAPAPSPQKSTSSSQIRRAMEDDLDTPINPYDHQARKHVGNRHEDEHGDPNVLNIDILEEKADDWDQRSGKFLPRKLPPHDYEDAMEIIPPPNASPSVRPVRQDTSFLGTGNHPPPPPSPHTVHRGPPNAYVNPTDFDENNIILPPNPSLQGNIGRSPMMRQSMPVTASARSSAGALPPVQPSDLPWATGKTATSQLPRQSMYEPAPSTAGMPPNTSTTWGYVRDSTQTVAPVGPIGNDGLGFTFRSSNMPHETYTLAGQSPMVGAGHLPGSARGNIMNIPGSTRSNIMNLHPPGSTRSNIMNIPGTNRSIVNPLPTTSQTMLERMLTPDAVAPEPDNEPIVPKKKAKKTKKK